MTRYEKLVKALLSDAGSQYTRDAAAAIEELQADNAAIQGELDALRVFTDEAQNRIEELQAEVERLEPKRGEWIINEKCGYKYQCSICGMFSGLDKVDVESGWTLNNYCPNCGAKMEVQDADK